MRLNGPSERSKRIAQDREATISTDRYFSGQDITPSAAQGCTFNCEAVVMGEICRAMNREEQERATQNRLASTVIIAVAIIAAGFLFALFTITVKAISPISISQ
jgi:uncharacterized protein (DUF697 family)